MTLYTTSCFAALLYYFLFSILAPVSSSSYVMPVIDLDLFRQGGDARVEMVNQLRSACKTEGFFYLANHGIPTEVTNSAVKAMEDFFDLPLEHKLQISINNSRVHPYTSRGYMKIGEEKLDLRSKSKIGDYKEVLDYFSIYKAFPDMDPNCFGFTVDPENPLRVWYFVRYVLYSGVVYMMHFIIQYLNHFLFLLELPEHTNNQLGDLWDQL